MSSLTTKKKSIFGHFCCGFPNLNLLQLVEQLGDGGVERLEDGGDKEIQLLVHVLSVQLRPTGSDRRIVR